MIVVAPGREPGEILRDRHVADAVVRGKKRLQRHGRRDLAHADHCRALGEDLPVDRLVEVLGLQVVVDDVIGVVVDQDGAEKRLFGFDVGRRLAVERRLLLEFACGFRHRSTSSDWVNIPLIRVGRSGPTVRERGPEKAHGAQWMASGKPVDKLWMSSPAKRPQ